MSLPVLVFKVAFETKFVLEDTYLMLDALDHEFESLQTLRPLLLMEIGSGSGCIISYLATRLRPLITCSIASDLNLRALQATKKTALKYDAVIDVVWTSLINGLVEREPFDIIIFNPPYVPSECTPEIHNPKASLISKVKEEDIIDAAWAGGDKGRCWIDLLLPHIARYLARHGFLYLIVSETNEPKQLRAWAKESLGLDSQEVLRRKSSLELLYVIKFWRILSSK